MAHGRIIGGKWRGARLALPPAHTTRPTADRVRETLFNVLTHNAEFPSLEGAVVFDVFCGSGAFGLEALSRGALKATFIDQDRQSLFCCQKNAEALKCLDQSQFVLKNALKVPFYLWISEEAPCWIFMDPPYGKGLGEQMLSLLSHRMKVTQKFMVVLEIGEGEPLPRMSSLCTILKDMVCGPARLLFIGVQGRRGGESL